MRETTNQHEGAEAMPRYVLLTAAYNEERFIGPAIESVISQSVLPLRWVIVSDGSTDRTDDVVRGYSARHAFIRFLRIDSAEPRGVVRKVNALKLAYREMQDLEHDFLANLDADVSLQSRYFETLLDRFRDNPKLGISGGLIYERRGGTFKQRVSNNERSVAHAAQAVRRVCYEEIGGYLSLKHGGEDWCAEVNARMKGWQVNAFADLKVAHHRPTGAADRLIWHRFRQGMMDFSVGSHPAFELLKCARRIAERPVAIGAVARLGGFCWLYAKKEPKAVSPEFASFLRNEQTQRLRLLFAGLTIVRRDCRTRREL